MARQNTYQLLRCLKFVAPHLKGIGKSWVPSSIKGLWLRFLFIFFLAYYLCILCSVNLFMDVVNTLLTNHVNLCVDFFLFLFVACRFVSVITSTIKFDGVCEISCHWLLTNVHVCRARNRRRRKLKKHIQMVIDEDTASWYQPSRA